MISLDRVATKRQLAEFIALPRRLYGGMAGFVAPLDHERRQLLDPESLLLPHPWRECLLDCARRGDAPVGRISAQIDHLATGPRP